MRRSLRLFTVTFKDEPPRGRPQSYSIPSGELHSGYPPAVSIPSTVSVKAGRRQRKLQQPSLPSPRAVSANIALVVDAAQTLSNPPWLIEANNTLLFEYIQYLTSQVHFSVIRSSLRENSKSTRPYALLQRSIQMAGVHLIEVFVRDHLFCVRLRAVELWRFSRRASRALMTGPLSSSILGQAAATAAATMASAIIAVDRSTASVSSLTGGVFNGASAVRQTQLESVTGPRGLSPPQASHHQQQQLGLPLNKIGKCSLKMLAETSKWEESSRLCDCTHLHSFLYDFYLRHVDAYLRRHSDLIGQRESPSLLFKSTNSTVIGDPLSAFLSPRSHAFLPNGYPVLQFLEHLELLSRTPPVFARGTFGRVRLAVSIGTRIKPEQVFDHLIDERHVYGLKAFELGNRRTGGSISAHHHLGICAFSEDAGQQQQLQHMNTKLSRKSSLLASNRRPGQPLYAPFGRHLLRGDSKPELTTTSTSPVVFSESSLSEEEEDDESEEEEENEQQWKVVDSAGKALGSGVEIEGIGALPTSGRGPNTATTPASRCLPRFKLPQTSFSVASVVFFDAAQSQLPSQQQKSQDSANDSGTENSYMTLSIFILLTDRQKRYPRTRLSSLPEGLPSKHTAPVHWPAIRPTFSFHSDLNKIPSLQRSGSHESAKSIVDDSDTKFSASKGPRIRHTSLMIRPKQETTEMENQLQRYSLNIQDPRGRQPTMADPGLRWKISYLGVWPSHQINLSRAFTRISNAWRKAIPEITNLAIINCHKNFLWYRLFDPKYFPLQCCFETRDLEQGEDIVASQSTAKPLQTNVHRGLTLEEFKDLIGSAPQQTDLLRMDHRLEGLLEIGCEHLTDMVASINALWQASNNNSGGGSSGSERLVAFLYEEPEMAPPPPPPLEATSGSTCWRMHLGLIAPSFPEGLVLLRWTEMRDLEKVEPLPPPSSSFGSSILGTPLTPPAEATLRALSHRYLPAPVEGTSLDDDAPGRRKCSNFSMKAIFRSTNTSDVISPRTGMLPVSASSQRMYDMAYQRSFLLPLVKKLVEHLSFFVWKDLH
ncbi:KICSTOR complex protein szt2 [Sparganum proliferum]